MNQQGMIYKIIINSIGIFLAIFNRNWNCMKTIVKTIIL